MDNKMLMAMLILIIPDILSKIMKHYEISELEATGILYRSHLYELLEEEETKLWQLSPLLLADMLIEERATGRITFPEGSYQ